MAITASGEVSHSRTKELPVRIAERRGLDSIRAKKLGGDNLFKLNAKIILEKHGIQSKKRH
jgi:hypothetical protein